MAESVADVVIYGMALERARLEAAGKNIANARSVAGKPDEVFAKLMVSESGALSQGAPLLQEARSVKQLYQPDHPLADTQGYVYAPDIDVASEMLKLNSSSRAYESYIQLYNAYSSMNRKALEIGK